jgi:hypothetical protein
MIQKNTAAVTNLCSLLFLLISKLTNAFHTPHSTTKNPIALHQNIILSAAATAMNGDDDNYSNKILVCGSANQDLTSYSDVMPTLGETVMGKDFATACGGKGANQAGG